jgi:hypothetical protein
MYVDIGKTIAQYIGNKGEAMAAEWLWLKGFQIVERNKKVGRFEIDLVCKDEHDWVFVEVKTRPPKLQWITKREKKFNTPRNDICVNQVRNQFRESTLSLFLCCLMERR